MLHRFPSILCNLPKLKILFGKAGSILYIIYRKYFACFNPRDGSIRGKLFSQPRRLIFAGDSVMRRHLLLMVAVGLFGSLVLVSDSQAGHLNWGCNKTAACEPCAASRARRRPGPEAVLPWQYVQDARPVLPRVEVAPEPRLAPAVWAGPVASPQWVAPSMQAPMAPSKQGY